MRFAGYDAGRWSSAIRRFRAMLFPPVCERCGRCAPSAEDGLCAHCATTVAWLGAPACPRCSLPGVHDPKHCSTCQVIPEPAECFSLLMAATPYHGVAETMIKALKYRGQTRLADPIARLMAVALRSMPLPRQSDPVLLIPVPLHPVRRMSRGFNQSEVLALALQRYAPWPCEVRFDMVKRIRYRRHQAALDRAGRLENLDDYFALTSQAPSTLAGRTALLVDDVATTGATLAACAAALRRAQPQDVHAVTFCRAYWNR